MSINEFEDDEVHLCESQDDERWTVLEAASNLLQDVAVLMPADVWDEGFKFFMRKIAS